MDIATSFSTPVVKIVNDKEVTFPRLSPPEVAEVASSLQARDAAKAKKLADEAGLKGIDRANYLSGFEDDYNINSVWQHAYTPKGAIEIVTKSLKKLGKAEQEIADTISQFFHDDLLDIAHEVTGYTHFLSKQKVARAAAEATPKVEA